jgi:ribonuclease Z
MKVTILGCHAATPRTFTNPTAQVIEIKNHFFLVDCAEGTQVQLRKSKTKFTHINHIFISHLHGDHFFGLIGLISTFTLLNRNKDLHIYGPKGIQSIIELQMQLSHSWTQFAIHFHELESKESEIIYEDKKVIVKTIPLKHRIYTNGFHFQEKPGERKLDVNAVLNYEIETCYYQKIKNGADITLENGTIIPNEKLTFDPLPVKSYAFCSDTSYTETIIPHIENTSCLYHEATFLESETTLAKKTMHSTAKQAATIALKSNCKQLILGHYSTRYKNLENFKIEAESIFQNVHLAQDGKVFEL